MRHTRSREILSEVYSARIQAIEALTQAQAGPSAAQVIALAEAVKAVDNASQAYGDATTRRVYEVFAELVRVAGFLCEWKLAIVEATPDGDRFLRAAKERSQALKVEGEEGLEALGKLALSVEQIGTVAQANSFFHELEAIPLPVGLYQVTPKEAFHLPVPNEPSEEKPQLAVAFLEFTIGGRPLTDVHFIAPHLMHDLDITVRVSRWPDKAERLVLRPVTVEHADIYQLPSFEFLAPTGNGPFKFTGHNRAIIKVAQSIHARPLEFKYVAEFEPLGVEQPIEVVGQRTLRLEAADWQREPRTGYVNIDKRLLEIRDQLRGMSGVSEDDIAEALTVVVSLGKLAGQAVQDNAFPNVYKEKEFQLETRKFLRSEAVIGSALQEHAHAGGGITDLTYKGIPVELKAETDILLELKDCQKFVGQSQAYTVANGKRVGVLCVLDSSPKTIPPFPVEDGIGVLFRQDGDRRVPIITVLIQGNLAKPSKFSA